MAKVTFVNEIDYVHGAFDSVNQGQANRMRLVVRRHDYGEGKIPVST